MKANVMREVGKADVANGIAFESVSGVLPREGILFLLGGYNE